MVNKKVLFVLVLVLALSSLLAACGKKETTSSPAPSTETAATPAASTEATAAPSTDPVASLSGKKIALLIQLSLGTFSAQYIDGVKEQVEKLGGTVQVFTAENDMAKMASNLDAAINQKFDGILIDHGTTAALEPGAKIALEKKIPIVSFDSELSLPDITALEQGDQKMAEQTLTQLGKDIGGKGSIVKIWVAGFAPMERRQIAYKAFIDSNPDIKEIAAFGAATNNTALDTQAQMEAILKKYPKKGDITAVWAAWDEFAKGAARAIQQAGRDEIKVYGIDLSDEDLQMIQDPKSPWIASAAVDPKDIGRVQVRFLYQKLHGDETPAKVVLDPIFVSRDQLPTTQVSTVDLGQHVKGWGGSEQGYTDWLKQLEQLSAKK
ncbi:sugar ABC transporter substrate-binding protein [Paenibacillus psychroresistens]|uniref:Sugar ABC transporter substrate-binding protein n=1 Tax=Paenibacillus psychroresistens TaxID=1778678 RepID=A0A6B8RUZ3_9BACL|nr:sugar ABC transporter substrate-binding protein [Paenibacillus psychroresistens]QGQ99589.1 sugar ABC transporter substrate-binding protein [Paenibacillus psychroresistens]